MRRNSVLLAVTLFLACFPLFAQTLPITDPTTEDGYKPYGSFAFGDFDSVNLMNLKLDLHIPLASFPQRGKALSLGFELSYSSGMFNYDYTPYIPPDGCDPSQCPGSDLISFSSSGGLYVRSTFGASGTVSTPTAGYSGPVNGVIETPDGTHITEPAANGVQYAIDGSGFTMVPGGCPQPVTGSQNNLVRTASGVSTCNPTLVGGEEFDTYGNSIVHGELSANNRVYDYLTDSVGRNIKFPPLYPGSVAPLDSVAVSTFQLAGNSTGCTGSFATVEAVLWNLPGPNGQIATYKLCYAQIPVTGLTVPCSTLNNISTNFSLCQANPSAFAVSPPVGMLSTVTGFSAARTTSYYNQVSTYLQSLVLPNNSAWTFTYDGTYGDLTSITSPAGGVISYTWGNYDPYAGASCFVANYPFEFSRVLTSRTVNANDGTGPHKWTYTQTQLAAPSTSNGYVPPYSIAVGNPDGTSVAHTFTNQSVYGSICSYYETSTQSYSAQGSLIQQVDTGYTAVPSGITGPITSYSGTNLNVFPSTITTTESGQVKAIQRDSDTGIAVTVVNPQYGFPNSTSSARVGNVIAERTYDYGSGSYGSLLKSVISKYLWQTDSTHQYLNAGLFNLVSSTCTALVGSTACSNSASDSIAYTTFSYDETGSPQGAHGAQTSINRWLNTTGALISTHATYNANGMIIRSQDAFGNATLRTYDSTGLYLKSVQLPSTSGASHLDQYSYDLSGALNYHIDQNLNKTSYQYDILGRPTSVSYPDGGSDSLSYNGDSIPLHVTYARSTGASSPPIVKDVWYDGAGRVTSIQATSDPAGVSYQKFIYDSLGRVAAKSNEYRTTSDNAYGWTSYAYDVLGRTIVECEQDNGTSNGACVPKAGYKQWSYSGGTTTLRDEAGSQWQQNFDGLGRLRKVTEPGSLVTTYSYDGNDNLQCADQWGTTTVGTPCGSGKKRSFTFDSLSRLLSANNPETGTISYNYLASGALCSGDISLPCSKTDARGTATTYTYDALSRLKFERYSDGTQLAGFGYDGYDENGNLISPALSYPVGRMTHVSNELNAAYSIGYDVMGHVSSEVFQLPSTPNTGVTLAAAYDLAGHLTDLTYPDGRHIKQTWNAAGSLGVTGKPAIQDVGSGQQYLQSVTYNPDGTPYVTTFGNGVAQTVTENNRLQVQSVTASSALSPFNGKSFLANTYCYSGCTTGGTANNGDIWGITDTLKAANTQGFTYDSLNRISSFSLGGAVNQSYTIDSFGNMSGLVNGKPATTFDPVTNRINNLPCASSVPEPFDLAGNQMCDTDPASQAVRQYQYDAESRISQITLLNASSPFETYVYGADGSRVRKTNASGTYTEYVDFAGQTVAERDQTGAWTDYVYANGKRIAQIAPNDIAIHMSGTAASITGANESWMFSQFNGYVFKAGDKLSWRQYQSTTVKGGIIDMWMYNWGGFEPSDTSGQPMQTGSQQNVWQQRTLDMTPVAGQTMQAIRMGAYSVTATGPFDIWIADLAIYSSDGTVIPAFHRQPSFASTLYGAPNITNPTIAVDSATVPVGTTSNQNTVSYSLSDHLGTAQLQFTGSGGWPVWRGQFAPFGAELDTEAAANSNHYKFTGKERDSESGLDYFGARYYSSNMGRWMSPDWADKPKAVPYSDLSDPQTLNLYNYVNNNPLSRVDEDGHCYPICTVLAGAFVGAAGEAIREAAAGKGFNKGAIAAAAIGGAVTGFVGPAGAAAGFGAAGTIAYLAGGAVLGDAAENITNSALSGKEGTDAPLTPQGVITDVIAAGASDILGTQAGKVGVPAVKTILEHAGNTIVEANRRVGDDRANHKAPTPSPHHSAPKEHPSRINGQSNVDGGDTGNGQ